MNNKLKLSMKYSMVNYLILTIKKKKKKKEDKFRY